MSKTILLIGAFDTKGIDYDFVRSEISKRGHEVVTINTGVLGTTDLFKVDVEAEEVANAGGRSLSDLRENQDRGEAMKIMTAGAGIVALKLFTEGRFDGALGMGGSGGSTVVTAALRILPLGVCLKFAFLP